MNRNKQGFTLIELLAVIVILGLLLAIAIPSVTKYITQSRKKTITTTIGNYIGALTNQVNDLEYIFTADNTVYAVPIECISLERGGTDPFGKWYQANDAYWAYVLLQYDDSTSSYTYGFTFKDSAGYGLYPTTSEKLNESGSQIQQDLSLNCPTNGTITNITVKDNWNGFYVQDNTNLVVLEATSEGEVGDGKTTCTLCQKGDNYNEIENNKNSSLVSLIKKHNTVIAAAPTLTTSSNNTSDASGLYSSNVTTNGNATYYFRGNVQNNHVSFANIMWRIIRVNEDGTVRLITSQDVDRDSFSSSHGVFRYMYYSNSLKTKKIVDNWYNDNIVAKGFDDYVATGIFCEEARVRGTSVTAGNATVVQYDSYTPHFDCDTDGNGKGVLNLKAGLITYDEAVYAGGYFDKINTEYYLYSNDLFWTMTPSGFNYFARAWCVMAKGGVGNFTVSDTDKYIRPVINLNANVSATGTGTSSDPYVIKTN